MINNIITVNSVTSDCIFKGCNWSYFSLLVNNALQSIVWVSSCTPVSYLPNVNMSRYVYPLGKVCAFVKPRKFQGQSLRCFQHVGFTQEWTFPVKYMYNFTFGRDVTCTYYCQKQLHMSTTCTCWLLIQVFLTAIYFILSISRHMWNLGVC